MNTFAGLSLDQPRIMGIINVTPDSFSDGGDFMDTEFAVAHGLRQVEEGADILDVGGESTRPGAKPITEGKEIARVIPVIRELAKTDALISIDSRHARVMEAALNAGAAIVNDVTALGGDPKSLSLVAEAGVPVVLVHMRGDPGTMQDDPRYDDVVGDIRDYLARRIEACVKAGIDPSRIVIDPGIGFGKTVVHNMTLIANLSAFKALGCPVMLGLSRKAFIGKLGGEGQPKQRLGGSLAANLIGVDQGADILRVHDVMETKQALSVWQAFKEL